MKRVVIIAAKRTPFGRFRGALAAFSPVDMAVAASEAAIGNLDRSLIDQVILGTVLAAGQGMNVARQVGVRLNLPLRVPAWSLNMMCGWPASGTRRGQCDSRRRCQGHSCGR